MGQQLTVQEQRRQSAVQFRGDFTRMEPELQAALPEHISVQKFMRIVLTAVNSDPNLLDADRKSLFQSAMQSAQDGLLPDKREGAFVIFSGKVQWMPMIAGVLKKVRNSGELLTIMAACAYENDRFLWVQGDDEKIEHEPLMEGDRGKVRAVYAIAKTKTGGIYREVMSVAEVEKVRKVSRAGQKGPWVEWWEEMARKTVLRRLSKRLPMSTDLEQVLSRDDAMYDFSRRLGAEQVAGQAFGRVDNPLLDQIEHHPETGEIEGDAGGQGVVDATPETEAMAKARQHGADTGRSNGARKPPKQITDEAEKAAWLAAYDTASAETESAEA